MRSVLRSRTPALLAGFLIMLMAGPAGGARAAAPALGVHGGSFTVDGQPKFLVFVSYFDGLDVSEADLALDCAWLQSKGVGGIRVMANWWDDAGKTRRYPDHPLLTHTGDVDRDRLAKLRALVAIAQRHGLVVDLSFSAENVIDCSGADCAVLTGAPVGTLTARELEAGLVQLAGEFRRTDVTNVLIDIQNEVDKNTLQAPGRRRAVLSGAEIARVAARIHRINPNQIVTASYTENTPPAAAAASAQSRGLDVATWHEYRREHQPWWNSTRRSVAAMRSRTSKPIYLQEPLPSDEIGWTASGAAAGLRAAIVSGAAAWTLHTRNSFDLNGRRLQTILSVREVEFLSRIR